MRWQSLASQNAPPSPRHERPQAVSLLSSVAGVLILAATICLLRDPLTVQCETRALRVETVVDPDLLTICPGDDRDVTTVRDLALRDIANRTAVDCANGKIVTIGVTLSRAAEM